MKKFVSMLLALVLLVCSVSTLASCKESEQNSPRGEETAERSNSTTQFKEGDIIVSSLGESYTQFVSFSHIYGEINGEKAEIISHKIEATRKLKITNMNDYAYREDYYQYLYTATVVGKVDSKYAGRAIYVYTHYPITVQTEVIDDYENGALVNDDGTFKLTYYVYCNEVLETFYPRRITIGK